MSYSSVFKLAVAGLGLFIFGTVDSCSRISRYPFVIDRDSSGTDLFKTNGLYHQRYEEQGKQMISFFIPYQNGTIYGIIGGIEGGVPEMMHYIENDVKKRKYPPLAYHWGVYNARDTLLEIEKWVSGDLGPYRTAFRDATILNDTTLRFTYPKWGTFKFLALKEKPDSTNSFTDY